jgi:flagellar basal-body rod protein FlgB
VNIEDRTFKALASSLNFRQMRQDLISSNIANAETPGYKSKRIDFDNQQTLNTDDPRHFNVGGGGFDNLEPSIYEDPNGVVSEDGNTVDRDEEMAKMAENKILYDASVALLNKKLGQLRYSIESKE